MTVDQLIRTLSNFPPDLPVVFGVNVGDPVDELRSTIDFVSLRGPVVVLEEGLGEHEE